MKYKTIIGLEIHLRLNTKTKMFCRCDNDDWEKKPNTLICPVCAGLPGALPMPNKEAFHKAILFAKAIGANVSDQTNFDRKNYFYPDNPAGYQITQDENPVFTGGVIFYKSNDSDDNNNKIEEITFKKGGYQITGQKNGVVRIHHAHLENDAGKNFHYGSQTLVDLNRSGSPLLEIVTYPDFRSPEDASSFLKELQRIARFLGISDAHMEKGEMKADCSISIAPIESDSLPKYRTEIKNINSFNFARQALEYERNRQIEILEKGGELFSETHGFDPDTGETYLMRSKEGASDYRYFHEPDILTVNCSTDQKTDDFRELPYNSVIRLVKQYGINQDDAESIVNHTVEDNELNLLDMFEKVVEQTGEVKQAVRWLLTELQGIRQDNEIKLTLDNLVKMIKLVQSNQISSKIAKDIFPEIVINGKDPEIILEEKGIKQVTDSSEIEKILIRIISENPDQSNKAKENPKLKQWFVGQVMKEMKGQANPQVLQNLIDKLM